MLFTYTILLIFGILIGNFTTTVFYRLPRNIVIAGFDQKLTTPPFCSSCGHQLRFYEYLPVLSWISTGGRCNYCHNPISKLYLALELAIGVIAVILYWLLGQNLEMFFICFCFTTLVVLNIFIYLKHNFISNEISLSIIILGMIYRTLIDGEVLLWVASFSCASIASLWIIRSYRVNLLAAESDHSLIHLILSASLWCPDYKILTFILFTTFSFLLSKATTHKLFYPMTMIALCALRVSLG